MPIIDINEEFTPPPQKKKEKKIHTPYASKSLSSFFEGWILDMLFNFVMIIITVFKEV